MIKDLQRVRRRRGSYFSIPPFAAAVGGRALCYLEHALIMGEFFDVRDAQNRGKHAILRRYAGAWAGIICNGLRQRWHQASPRWREKFDPHLIFIDGFAGEGRYRRDANHPSEYAATEPIWGSPIIGLQALEEEVRRHRLRGMPLRVSGVINTSRRDEYDILLGNLRAAGLEAPIEEASTFTSSGFGKVNVFNEDFRLLVPALCEWLPGSAFVLALIDPYGPVMDLDRLARLVGRKYTDVITLFPSHDLNLRGGSSLKDEDEWTASDRGNLTRTTQHFGTDEWIQIYSETTGDPKAREERLVKLYVRQLQTIDPDVTVKTIRYRFSGVDRTAYHLCLLTRDPDGSMKFNEILRKAQVEEKMEFWRDGEAKRREQSRQDSLFDEHDPEMFAPKVEPYKALLEDVEDELYARVRVGRAVSLKEIYGSLSATIFTPDEIKRCLRKMASEGCAQFEDLDRARSIVLLNPRR